ALPPIWAASGYDLLARLRGPGLKLHFGLCVRCSKCDNTLPTCGVTGLRHSLHRNPPNPFLAPKSRIMAASFTPIRHSFAFTRDGRGNAGSEGSVRGIT